MSGVEKMTGDEVRRKKAPERSEGILGERLTVQHREWLLLTGYVHLEQHRYTEASTIFRILFRVDPENAQVVRCLALSELLAGDPISAARVATKAMQLDGAGPHRIPVGLVFARALWSQGKHEAAREYAVSLLNEKREENEEADAG